MQLHNFIIHPMRGFREAVYIVCIYLYGTVPLLSQCLRVKDLLLITELLPQLLVIFSHLLSPHLLPLSQNGDLWLLASFNSFSVDVECEMVRNADCAECMKLIKNNLKSFRMLIINTWVAMGGALLSCLKWGCWGTLEGWEKMSKAVGAFILYRFCSSSEIRSKALYPSSSNNWG